MKVTQLFALHRSTQLVRCKLSQRGARLTHRLSTREPKSLHRPASQVHTRSSTIMNGHTHPSTPKMDQLASSLQSLGVSKIPSLPDVSSYPTLNQIDIYRSHITELLEPITGASAKVIYPALQWTQTLEYGDLMLPVPALRIKGKKPDELAKEISDKVYCVVLEVMVLHVLTYNSSRSLRSFRNRQSKRPLFASSSNPTL